MKVLGIEPGQSEDALMEDRLRAFLKYGAYTKQDYELAAKLRDKIKNSE